MKADDKELKQINDLITGGMDFIRDRIATEIEKLETEVQNADFAQGFKMARDKAARLARGGGMSSAKRNLSNFNLS